MLWPTSSKVVAAAGACCSFGHLEAVDRCQHEPPPPPETILSVNSWQLCFLHGTSEVTRGTCESTISLHMLMQVAWLNPEWHRA